MSQRLDSAEEILAAARQILPWMTDIRRDLHQHPELGLEEHRTAKQVQQKLDELGIEHVDGLAQTGVLGIIPGDSDGPVVALRADLDEFRSKCDPVQPSGSTYTGRSESQAPKNSGGRRESP